MLKLGQCYKPRTNKKISLSFYTGFTTTATEADMVGNTKVIVSFSQLQQLIPTVCLSQGCDATVRVTERF